MKLRRRRRYTVRPELAVELLEPRQLLAVTPVPDFFLDAWEEPALVHFAELQPNLSQVHAATGVAAVRDAYGLDGYGQTVVIVDSGIAWDHVALGGGYGSGYKVVGGWDFAENDADPYDDGPAGFHGTHVAGIIASNDSVYVGVAPGVDLVALRVFNDAGAGYFSWVEQALQWVHTHRDSFRFPITTVNMSLGTNWNSTSVPSWSTIEDELAQLAADGITVTVAAGNAFAQYQTPGLSYPASSPYVIPVMSLSPQGTLSSFSQRHGRAIAAPGERITSTVPDHTLGADGVPNDFATASGTSMAAPYLAGIAVLVRQAMQFVGVDAITPQLIYQHLRNTADTVYDAVTRSTYLRANAQRAVDALMPADDYGSSPDTAHDLGTLRGANTLSGTIHRLDDVDYFRFVAGQSGRVQLQVNATDWMVPNVTVTGTNLNVSGPQLSFDVTAGESYLVAVRTSGGIGHYQLALAAPEEAAQEVPVDWGLVHWTTRSAVPLDAGTWYRIQATLTGTLTIEARALDTALQIDVQTPEGQSLARQQARGTARVDLAVRAGQELLVRFTGEGTTADVSLLNLLQQSGGQWRLAASPSADTVHIQVGATTQVVINGIGYELPSSSFRSAQLDGFDASDALVVVGTNSRETWALQPNRLTYSGPNFRLTVSGFGSIDIDGLAGGDSVTIGDSPGNDRLSGDPTHVTLAGTGYRLSAARFGSLTVSGSQGLDTAELSDSAGNDTYRGSPTEALLQGTGYSILVRNFDQILVESKAGGFDRAILADSPGNDRFYSDEQQSTLEGSGFRHTVRGFDELVVTASRGYDQAKLEGSTGGDLFESWGATARLRTAVRTVLLAGFDTLEVDGLGGSDQAVMQGTRGADYFQASIDSALFAGNGWNHRLYGFQTVRALGGGGRDSAVLIGTPEADLYTGSPGSGTLAGPNYRFEANGFSQIVVQGNGGTDTAQVYGRGRGDRYQRQVNSILVWGTGYSHVLQGFSQVAVYAGSSNRLLGTVQLAAPGSGANQLRPLLRSGTALAGLSQSLIVDRLASGQAPAVSGTELKRDTLPHYVDEVLAGWPSESHAPHEHTLGVLQFLRSAVDFLLADELW
ncbi:MAG: hypothetical protein KatS3mg109_1057 [Pirellulaceae bacterium]|nr:MAG: hypothetical protein KatS3mg109_1057 [Pirellulaceae bacterium]